jgi:hypothetical protein
MKLTTQQIAKIDETLVLNGLIYEDIKLEVTDHIASEIENAIKDNSISFEEAFNQAFENWNDQLQPSSSFWIGSKNVAPKVVLEKFLSLSKRQYKFALLSAVVFSILMITITMLNTQEYVYNALKLIFSSAYILLCLTLITCLIYIWKLKLQTTCGRFFQKSCGFLGMHFYLIYTIFNGYSHLYRHYNRGSFTRNFSEWFINGFFFFIAVYSILIAIEHFKTVKKYKLT